MTFASYSKKQSRELSERHGKGELDGMSRVVVKAVGSADRSAGPSSRMIEHMKRTDPDARERFSIRQMITLREAV